MKKLFLLAVILPVCFSVFSQNKVGANRNSGALADGYFKVSTTKVPLPLGRYVQLSSTSIPFKFSKPNGNGDGEYSLTFNFEILRHVPNLKYCDIRMYPAGEKQVESFPKFKLKYDDDAVEQLTNAVANERVTKVAVKYTVPYSDLVSQEIARIKREWNGTEVVLTSTEVSRDVPIDRVLIVGSNPGNIRVKDADISLYWDRGLQCSLSINISSLSNEMLHSNRVIAKMTTKGGNVSVIMGKQDIDYNYYLSFDKYIDPRAMDALLTYPINVELEFE